MNDISDERRDMHSEINWNNASIRKQAVSMLSGNDTSSHLEGDCQRTEQSQNNHVLSQCLGSVFIIIVAPGLPVFAPV